MAKCLNPVFIEYKFKGTEFKNLKDQGENNKTNKNILRAGIKNGKLIPAGCGKCKNCKINKVAEWTERMKWESKEWKNKYFVTLTYTDENRPWQLEYRDAQLFLKRLRKHIWKHGNDEKLKYYIAGEYGERGGREHFHLIIFTNWKINDLKPLKQRKGGTLYTSKIIEEKWGKGYITVGIAGEESFAYVAYYTAKDYNKTKFNKNVKLLKSIRNYWELIFPNKEIGKTSKIEIFKELNRIIEFQEMKKPSFGYSSKKPVIGKNELEKIREMWKNGTEKIGERTIPKGLVNLLPENEKQQYKKLKKKEYFEKLKSGEINISLEKYWSEKSQKKPRILSNKKAFK